MKRVSALKPIDATNMDRKNFHIESLMIKINHVELALQKLGFLKSIDVFSNDTETKLEIYFYLKDTSYIDVLSKILKNIARIESSNILIYEIFCTFERHLFFQEGKKFVSLGNSFFVDPLDSILARIQEIGKKFIRQFIQEAIQEFCELRSKRMSERDFRMIKQNIYKVSDPLDYIADIRCLVDKVTSALLFRKEYNRFFEIGKPALELYTIRENEESSFEDEQEDHSEASLILANK